MDRNTVIGLVLIGIVFSVFTIFNQPSPEELAKQKKELKAKEEAKKKKEAEKKKNKAGKQEVGTDSKEKQNYEFQPKAQGQFVPKKDASGKAIKQGNGYVYTNTANGKDSVIIPLETRNTASIKGELIRIQNERLIIDLNTKGGQVAAVYLKDYENYSDFAKKTRGEKKDRSGKNITPLNLFRDGDAMNELFFKLKGKNIHTAQYLFDVVQHSPSAITFRLDMGNGQVVEQQYKLKKNAFDLDFDIRLKGMNGSVNLNRVAYRWKTAFRKTERLFSEQRRVTTVCFYNKSEGIDYLSEMGNDYAQAEESIEWIAYKQSYFSSILRPDNGFSKQGTEFKSKEYTDKHPKKWSHLKDFSSTATLKFPNSSDASVSMNWYFGPNDYEMLKSYHHSYDDILNFGWGLFRWINLYAVQPLFNFLVSMGISVGLSILLLTLILKFILMPIQWKMFISSVKMRILKPEIDKINEKYTKQDDAMKKQMEMMTLYRESGASPLSGCVPMLIQMPILLAVFRFFPAAFELRQQPFLWAEDLSSYDSILDFGFNIWPYGDHVSLFTLLMAATTLAYTFMNSGNVQQPTQPGMPNMKFMMYLFPILMIFFFNNYSSGLSYYYFISTLISILIMVVIKRFFVDEEKLKLQMAEKKSKTSNGPKKKSKFQEKLEQMQKAQQEQMRKRKK
jgi:YidC/Oxa1 family membrane protein insertase